MLCLVPYGPDAHFSMAVHLDVHLPSVVAACALGSAAGAMVTVKMNGKHEVLSITIKPEAVDPDDIEMLEDMVAAAINATVKQVDETAEAEMGKLTGGLNIPGL